MKKIIASIKLAPGNRGYFDPLTGINLTISNSIGYIREDDDVSNIRKAIREGKVKIVGGQLPPAINNIKPVKEVKKEKPVEIKKEKIEVITPVVEDKKQPKIATIIKKKEEPKIEPKKEVKTELKKEVKTELKKEPKEEPVKAGE